MGNPENNSAQIDLTQPGVAEGLVQNGRAPFSFHTGVSEGQKRAGCLVPPAGFDPKTSKVVPLPAMAYCFLDADGNEIGYATFHEIPFEELDNIKNRVRAALAMIRGRLVQK